MSKQRMRQIVRNVFIKNCRIMSTNILLAMTQAIRALHSSIHETRKPKMTQNMLVGVRDYSERKSKNSPAKMCQRSSQKNLKRSKEGRSCGNHRNYHWMKLTTTTNINCIPQVGTTLISSGFNWSTCKMYKQLHAAQMWHESNVANTFAYKNAASESLVT